jgi:anti-sigma regulatory factor (Ser/Thr protein kinase)
MAQPASNVRQARDHLVDIYDDDRDLVKNVSKYLSDGLNDGQSVVVIGTPAHRTAFAAELTEAGIDTMLAAEDGRYCSLDAAETLEAIMKGGRPDPDLFVDVVGSVVATAGRVRPVRAFGEMVTLLWDAGEVVGALALEELWNALRKDHVFTLYCSYPLRSLTASGDLVMASRVCGEHSDLVPPRSYWEPGSRDLTDISSRQSVVFIPTPSAISPVRRFVTETLSDWALADLIADAVVVASELATNAVRHANSAFRISLERATDAVRVEVEDVSSTPPTDAQDRNPASLGLHVVEALAKQWGTEPRATGKVIWAELGVPA